MGLDIWVIDHRGVPTTSTNAEHVKWAQAEKEQADPGQPRGDIIGKVNPRTFGSLDEKFYAETTAVHGVWGVASADPPDYIGFWGYRKYLWTLDWFSVPTAPHCEQAPGWVHTPRANFDAYRNFLSTWDGAPIIEKLQHVDIIQAAPYTYTASSSLEDFAMYCGTKSGADALFDTLKKHGCFDIAWNKTHPQFHMITRWEVFDRMMRELEPMRQDLHMVGLDSVNEDFRSRAGSYFMERLYSMWLHHAGLNVIEVPLLYCRELGIKSPSW